MKDKIKLLKIKKPTPTKHSKSEGVADEVSKEMNKAVRNRFSKFISKLKK